MSENLTDLADCFWLSQISHNISKGALVEELQQGCELLLGQLLHAAGPVVPETLEWMEKQVE
jgi:hypothetical protein